VKRKSIAIDIITTTNLQSCLYHLQQPGTSGNDA